MVKKKRQGPFPVQLGELKPILTQEAYENDRSLHYWIKKILKEHCVKKEKREINFGKEKNDNAGV